MSKEFCFLNVSNNDHAKLAHTMVQSARKAGIKEDFHIFHDLPQDIPGAKNYKVESKLDISGCWFKLEYLLKFANTVELPEYVCWIDSDNYFVKTYSDPVSNFLEAAAGGVSMIILEDELTGLNNKRGDWWGISTPNTVRIFRELGCKAQRLYNTNGGLFMIRKDFIKAFYQLCQDFRQIINKKFNQNICEEYVLAIISNLFNVNPSLSNMSNGIGEKTWCCDWKNVFANALPDGSKAWEAEHYLSGDKYMVNPSIVHVMKNKPFLVAEYTKFMEIQTPQTAPVIEPVRKTRKNK